MTTDQLRSEITSWLEAQGYRVWPCNWGGLLSQARIPELGAAHLQRPGPIIRILVAPKGVDPELAEWHRELRAKGVLVVGASSVEDVRKALSGAVVASEAAGNGVHAGGAPNGT